MAIATATKGRRILLSFAPLVILWALLTIFIHMNLDVSHDKTKQQAPSSLGRHRHSNPRDMIRAKVSLADHGRLLSGRALDAISQRRTDTEGSFHDLRSRMKTPKGIDHQLERLEHRERDPIEDRKRPPQSRVMYLKEVLLGRKTGKHMVLEPKIYDTQGQATVCVSRNVETNTCQLHRCGIGGDAKNENKTLLDDYGFVVHEHNNTRGQSPVTAGRALVGSGCAISHRYKFLFIHVLKSGGMTIKTLLKRGLCGGVTQECADLRIVDCTSAVRGFPHYFVFSFVRNPFSRIYSAFSMADSMPRRNLAPVSFDKFATMTRGERRDTSKTSPTHYNPQVNFLMDHSYCPVFDFLGRLERFRDDMQIILNQIQSPDLQAYFTSTGGNDLRDNCTSFGERKKQSELGGKLRNAYRSQTTVDAIAQEFESDFTLLGYDPTQVP